MTPSNDPTDQTPEACATAMFVGAATGHAWAICPGCGAWAIAETDAHLHILWDPNDHGRRPVLADRLTPEDFAAVRHELGEGLGD